jgi:hypothetical protein
VPPSGGEHKYRKGVWRRLIRATFPCLFNQWHARRTLRNTAPSIKVAGRLLKLDPTSQGWDVIEATNAWEYDPPRHNAEHVLESNSCSAIGPCIRGSLRPDAPV